MSFHTNPTKTFLILFFIPIIFSLSSSCGKDSDLFEIISEEQVDESEEVSDPQNEEEGGEDVGDNDEDQGGNDEDRGDTDGDQGDTDGDQDDTDGDQDDTDGDQGDTDGDQGDTDGDQGDTDGDQGDTDGDQGDTDGDTNSGGNTQKINIIFDTDANNELDDQHALAYLVSNGDVFNLEAVSIVVTNSGGSIDNHFDEAFRVLSMYNLQNTIDIYRGATNNYETIEQNFNPNNFQGQDAVDQIIQRTRDKEIVIVAVGSLTNIALAIRKDPSIVNRTKVIWLGSNYPASGEFNLQDDTGSVNFVIDSGIPLEIVTVRLGSGGNGSAEVFTSVTEIKAEMPGLGPQASSPVSGRDGGTFSHFGDYSIDLFANIGKEFRSLFDLVALSILKNPQWGNRQTIPAPILVNGNWVDRPNNSRRISIWENFNREAIIDDFFESIENYSLVD